MSRYLRNDNPRLESWEGGWDYGSSVPSELMNVAKWDQSRDAPVVMVAGRWTEEVSPRMGERVGGPHIPYLREAHVKWAGRARLAGELRRAGETFAAIGRHLGVSRSRAEALVNDCKRRNLLLRPEEVR